MEATIDGLILLGGNYPVAIVSMICLCRSIVNGLNKVADCWISQGVYPNHKLSTSFSQRIKLAHMLAAASGALERSSLSSPHGAN
jgi:hypothetical protein